LNVVRRLVAKFQHGILAGVLHMLAVSVGTAANAAVMVRPVGHEAVAVDPREHFFGRAADEAKSQAANQGERF
jgi:hypothetical protein